VSAQISLKTSFEMMFMFAQMTDVLYPASIHAHLSSMPNSSCSALISYQDNDLEFQGLCSLDWKKKLSTGFKHKDGLFFGVDMSSVALLR
jgi:hypothetical protein